MAHRKLGNPVREHKAAARVSTNVAVVTLSDSRSLENDQSGAVIQERLEAAGHHICSREVIRDDSDALRSAVRRLMRRAGVDAIVTTGGTGLSSSDITVETVRPLLDKELTGFNALLMQLSYRQAKSAAMLSRAVAGTIQGKPIFCLPGSPRACKLAVDALIAPELGHILAITGR